jgi:hypothetical protein
MTHALHEELWSRLGEELLLPLTQAALAELDPQRTQATGELNLRAIPYLATLHLLDCMAVSVQANACGRHAVAICLARQCVEALTLLDVGCQPHAYAAELLSAWEAGRMTQGQLRARLEKDVWLRYGHGLWEEPWQNFFANLARAVQPYAHYSPELKNWQFSILDYELAPHQLKGNVVKPVLVAVGPNTYDRLKGTRVMLLLSLILWTLGRLLVANGRAGDLSQRVMEFGTALGSSSLLFERGDWGSQLVPHMFFKKEAGWRGE